jgi:hypothetical protein
MIERIAQTLREEPVRKPGTSFEAKVMAAIKWGEGEEKRPAAARAALKWFVRPRSIRLSPLTGLAFAASVGALAFLGAGSAMRSMISEAALSQSWTANTLVADSIRTRLVQFVLVAPDAKSVSLVGDFNNWNPTATPLKSASGNLWTVEVPLTPGRYNYVFMVDGATLVPDPTAPKAADDFGQTNSVVTVGSSAS